MSISKLFPSKSPHSREDHWIPLSDLMTGMMMIFMLVAIVFMIKVEAESDDVKALERKAELQAERMKDIALVYDETRDQIYNDLKKEFQYDFPIWRAQLDRELTVRFEEPKVLFDSGKYEVKPEFKKILDDFIPRYVKIIKKYRDSVEEVRIEGHTSSIWQNTTGDEAYFNNMELSQSRTRSVLNYVLLSPSVAEDKAWLIKKVTANGLSSSRLRTNPDGSENVLASQRVEFRIRTNADARISEILKASER